MPARALWSYNSCIRCYSVDCDGQYWEKDEKVTFTHVDTGVVLYSHAKAFPRCGAVCATLTSRAGLTCRTHQADCRAVRGVWQR